MVLPSAEALTPCLTKRLSPERRNNLKEKYRKVKKYGIRFAFGSVTGAGVVSLAKDLAKDQVVFDGKRYLGTIFIAGGLTSVTAGIPLVTNATKIVKYGKACHSVCAAAWRASHNIAELPLIACDFALFGEYVPSCGESDYDVFSPTVTDVISSFEN